MALIQSTTVKLSGVNSTAAHPSLTGVTAGNTLVWVTNTFNTSDKVPTDSAGQTWSKAKFYNPVAPHECDIGVYYLLNANAGTHTLSWLVGDAPNGGYLFGTLSECPPSSGLDVAGSGTVNSGGNPTSISASVTTSAASTFAFGSMCIGSNSGNTNCNISNPPSGWTAVGVSQNSSADQAAEVCYKEQTSAGAQTANWTFTADPTSADVSALAVSFVNTGAAPTAALTAVSSTGGIGSITLGVGLQLNVSGNSATGAPGTAVANVSVALTGVSAAGSVGTVQTGPPILGNVTATGSAGTAKANFSLNLSGTSAAGAVSNVGAGGSVVLGSLSAGGSIGAVGPNFSKTIAGVTGTCTVGAVGAGLSQPLAGVSSTTSLTSVGANVSVALTGVSSTCTVGTLQPPGTRLGAVTATGAVGQLGLTVAHALSGLSGTLTPGSVRSTPTSPISGVVAAGSVGTVRFGNVVVGLTGVTAIGSVGTVLGPVRPDTGNGELFAAQQMAQALTYVGFKPVPNQRGAILYDSGSWTVPLGANTVFVSATAAGGTPRGGAGDQVFKAALPVQSGQQINVNFLSNGDVSLYVGSTLLLYLFAGPAGGQDAWQSTLGKSSGIPGDFGSGVDAGRAHPPIVVLFWSPS